MDYRLTEDDKERIKLLEEVSLNQTKTAVNLETYKSGIYILQVFNDDNLLVKSKFFLKE